MSPTVLGLLRILGIALVAVLLVGFAIATDSWGSMLLFVGWIAFGVYLLRRSGRRRGQ